MDRTAPDAKATELLRQYGEDAEVVAVMAAAEAAAAGDVAALAWWDEVRACLLALTPSGGEALN